MATLTEYKIFCLTEGQVVRGYTTGLLVPTCPHNPDHAVIPSTLVKVGELDEEMLQMGTYCQRYDYELNVPGGVGMTGLDIPVPLPAEITSFSYQGSPGFLGDSIDASIISGSTGATGVYTYLANLPLTSSNTFIPLSVNAPANSVNSINYNNNNGLPKTFRFSTQLCY